MLRETATPVLKKLWDSIHVFERKWHETGDVNYLNQMNGLIKQSLEIMNNVTNQENEENLREDGRDRGDSLSRW